MQVPPRVFLTHMHPLRLPREHIESRGRLILLVRNPRDTLVSHREHVVRHDIYDSSELDWNTFFECWLQGKSKLLLLLNTE